MSIIYEGSFGWYISHEKYINEIYTNLATQALNICINPQLFDILTPYKSTKSQFKEIKIDENPTTDSELVKLNEEIKFVESVYANFCVELQRNECFNDTLSNQDNSSALKVANSKYIETKKHLLTNCFGANPHLSIIKPLGGTNYIFPANCSFFCKDVKEINQNLNNEKFDIILLDPPWWNKYIRRKRKKSEDGYSMLYNEDLKALPIEHLLKDDGLVVVWCTNSPYHLNNLKEEIFSKWQVSFSGKWFWVKITKIGEPICNFSKPPRKQPFEQIIFGCGKERSMNVPPDKKIVVSVPSALHSHKPPLNELLKPYLGESSSCLEIFARYLLPGWTSYGNEALRFQHESIYNIGVQCDKK